MRWRFNALPAFRGTGAWLTYLADDWSEVRLCLPLNWATRNVVGTIFGGSIGGALDPVYMVMLIRLLGPAYVVWDKSATLEFLRPGRTTLYSTFRVGEDELAAIRAAVAEHGRVEREYVVEMCDASGVVHARCRKLISIRRAKR